MAAPGARSGRVEDRGHLLAREKAEDGSVKALGRDGVLRRLGDRLQRKVPGVVRSGFRMIPQLHFLSFFVIPGEGDGPALLALEANFDGSRQDFLARLVEQQRPLLDRIYNRCLGYPGRDTTPESVCRYLDNANRNYQLFHVGCPGLSVGEIEQEAVLRDRIEQSARARRALWPEARDVRQIWCELTPDERNDIRRVPPVRFGCDSASWKGAGGGHCSISSARCRCRCCC